MKRSLKKKNLKSDKKYIHILKQKEVKKKKKKIIRWPLKKSPIQLTSHQSTKCRDKVMEQHHYTRRQGKSK
jgi:hypothetical protein